MLKWLALAGLLAALGSVVTAALPPPLPPPLSPSLPPSLPASTAVPTSSPATGSFGTEEVSDRDIYAAIVSQCMSHFGGGPSWMWCHCATLNIMTFGTDIEQLIIADCGRAPRAA